MRDLKDIRDKFITTDEKKIADKLTAVIDDKRKELNSLRDELADQKQQILGAEETVSLARGEKIIKDATDKAKQILAEALRDQEINRELHAKLGTQLTKTTELLDKTEATEQEQTKTAEQLRVKETDLLKLEEILVGMEQEAVYNKTASVNLLGEIVTVINILTEKVEKLSQVDHLERSQEIAMVLGKISARLAEKEAKLAEKDKELVGIYNVLDEKRRTLNRVVDKIGKRHG